MLVNFPRLLTVICVHLIVFSDMSTGFTISTRTSRFKVLFLGESDSNPMSPRAEEVKGLKRALKFVAAGLTVGSLTPMLTAKAEADTKISIKPLPYDYDELMPYISAKTLEFHHDKHHGKYIATTLSMIKGTDLEGADLVSVMKNARGIAPVLFNNAAQSWNHDFYWNCMKKGGGGPPASDKIGAAIVKNFGTYDAFRTQVPPSVA